MQMPKTAYKSFNGLKKMLELSTNQPAFESFQKLVQRQKIPTKEEVL